MSQKTDAKSAPWFRPTELPSRVTFGADPYTGALIDVDTGERISELDGLADKLAEYRDLQVKIRSLEERMKVLRAPIEEAMGEATLGVIGDTPVLTWRHRVREALDTKALKRDHPEIHRKYLKKASSRFFVVK